MGKPRFDDQPSLPGTVWRLESRVPCKRERADGHLVGFTSSPQASDGGVLCVCSRSDPCEPCSYRWCVWAVGRGEP
ncbi:hypothetical protein MDA_GLEAN10016875 [Myotis davidii]|uniref:Uncharacterized protein n=1 Tax=Myotis davidii TaxID=225400 RepID=L5LLT6_MYODS|nr:hypothetical protein MDA_GLEAN10016875 [Myotis davidii]